MRPALPRRLALALLANFMVSLPVSAHEPGLSHASLQRQETGLVLSLRFDTADWKRLEQAGVPDAGVLLRASGDALRPTLPAEVRRAGDHVDVRIAYPPSAAGTLRFAFTGFHALRLGHRQYVELQDADGDRIADALLQESAPAAWLGSDS